MTGSPEPTVAVDGLTAGYAPGVPALTDVTFAAGPGQAVALLGPNGGGKTTLLRALLGELPATAGSVHLEGRPAYVPQSERSRLDFPVCALDVALMGAYGRTRWYARVSRTDRDGALAMLDRVGLADRARSLYGELSGGQRQRVLLARALVQDSRVLLLDEPLSGVDPASAERILGVIDELRAEGRTLLVATHDVDQARRWDRVLCLRGRAVAYGPPSEVLVSAVIEATYGAELVHFADGTSAVAAHHDCGH